MPPTPTDRLRAAIAAQPPAPPRRARTPTPAGPPPGGLILHPGYNQLAPQWPAPRRVRGTAATPAPQPLTVAGQRRVLELQRDAIERELPALPTS